MKGAGLVADIFNLGGRTVLVTGASSGLGAHFAQLLARCGCRVALAARRRERLEVQVAQLQENGLQAAAFALDVTSRESVVRCLEEVEAHFGALQVVVNNAGVSKTRGVLEYEDRDWDEVVDTNLKGAWMVAQESARRMVASGTAGSIVNVTSILAERVAAGVGPYGVAKAGLANLTRSMALELARHDIRVNALAPGYIVTELNRDFLASEQGERLRKRIPSRQFCEFTDLEGPLLLLVSDASRRMSGAEVVVDGAHLCSGL